MGIQHRKLEIELKKFLGAKNLTLFCNGTLALQLALKALNIKGNVITTPFTFPATINVLFQCNIKPIFSDISSKNFNINPDIIKDLINEDTSAIMPVHVFGNPCDIERIEKIASEYDLKVIYDAAHCFGVEYKGKPISSFGDVNMFSFHATKIFHTLEGGALTYKDQNLKELFYLLKNFGIKNEEEVILPGTNAKMNEIQAAMGLLNLGLVNREIKKRKNLVNLYKELLGDINGIRLLEEERNVKKNYQYFPILVIPEEFGITRNQLYEQLKMYNVFSRKYFYPLCTNFKFLEDYNFNDVPIAEYVSERILCLPLYGNLKSNEVCKICKIIKYLS
jgi:dTDP-4-amino-4,6-dideoxygalactose transaminase